MQLYICVLLLSINVLLSNADEHVEGDLVAGDEFVVHASLNLKVTGDEYLFTLEATAEITKSAESLPLKFTWTLIRGDGADFTSNLQQFYYWPKNGGFYKWKLSVCNSNGLCGKTYVSMKIKRFTHCQRSYQQVMSMISPLAFPRVADLDPPTCTKRGRYTRAQCQGFSMIPCYCVEPKTGKRVFEDFAFMYRDQYHCKREPRPCERLLIESQNPLEFNPELRLPEWLPKCRKNGWYRRKQCRQDMLIPEGEEEASGFCWCVTKEGEEIADTRTPIGTKLNCRRR